MAFDAGMLSFIVRELNEKLAGGKVDKIYQPGKEEIVNLTHLVLHVLQPLRDVIGESIPISSGYRSPALNKLVGGVSNSQHVTGQAADIAIGGNMTKGKQWFNYIKNNLPFDQLIWEHNKQGVYWIHVSYNKDGNRKQIIDNLLKR